jgi:hypothetical protein
MKTDKTSRISMAHIQYVYKQFQRNPKSVRPPLPVSVFCYRITDTTFGFMSSRDRDLARYELGRFANTKEMNLGFTIYRDVNANIAAQVTLWHRDGQPGGLSIHHGGVVKDCRYRNVVTGRTV